MTLKDIAHETGVTTPTVSRALSNPGRVSAQTAKLVWDAADRLGYDRTAITPVTKVPATGAFAVLCTDLARSFYHQNFVAIQAAAKAVGWDVIVCDAAENPKRERPALERVLDIVDGVILVAPRMSDNAIKMIAKQKPTVVVSRHVRGVSSILPDTADAMRQAADHLASLGHEEITWLAGPSNSWMSAARRQGLEDHCARIGVRLFKTGPGRGTIEAGRQAVAQFLDRPTTAVVAYNDDMAAGFMLRMQELGRRIPEDVSVVGIDNVHLAEVLEPGLTTLGVVDYSIGRQAVERLLRAIESHADLDPDELGERVRMRLVVRQSTGPAPGRAMDAVPDAAASDDPPTASDGRRQDVAVAQVVVDGTGDPGQVDDGQSGQQQQAEADAQAGQVGDRPDDR